MMSTLSFAQISDIHISEEGDQYDMLSGRSAEMLAAVVHRLNRQPELDFVLVSGDLVNTAHPVEFSRFERAIRPLRAPCYIIPGNHDRRPPDRTEGLSHHRFVDRFIGSRGYWSRSITPAVQLIGLDSTRAEDWGGQIDRSQLAWLEQELAARFDKLVILAVHHPLHPLAPVDRLPEWSNFVCDNGPEMIELLDRHPQVKIVLTGHHHLNRVDQIGDRLHLACPAVAIYPCAYRLLRLERSAEAGWRLGWQTEPAADPTTIDEAKERMRRAWGEIGFAPDFIERHVELALGRPWDRQGWVVL